MRVAALRADDHHDDAEPLATLRRKVSLAVLNAQRHGAEPGTVADALRQISLLEEQVADLTCAATIEGAEAREVAVRAALDAKDALRALFLVTRFLEDPDVPHELSVMLGALQIQANTALDLGRASAPVRYVRFGFAA
jgi:hypothetical protein